MSEAQIRSFRLLIIPGGNFIEIGKGLTSDTTRNIRGAVHDGLNYLGVCAGALFASNHAGYNDLNLTSDVKFGFYSAEEKGIRKAVVRITFAAASPLDQYWEDGPQLSGWGEVVAKYPDGTPAIVEGTFGNGWVILTGVHPEATDNWRRGMNFTTPASVDRNYAVSLIQAALKRESLPHY